MGNNIVVPEGMLKAAVDAIRDPSGAKFRSTEQWALCGLKAALAWLAENPIVPSEEQVKSLLEGTKLHWGWDTEWASHTRDWLVEWQRWMFAAGPEPEVPEEIKDKLWEPLVGTPLNSCVTLGIAKDHDTDVLEAFRRGQNSKEASCTKPQ